MNLRDYFPIETNKWEYLGRPEWFDLEYNNDILGVRVVKENKYYANREASIGLIMHCFGAAYRNGVKTLKPTAIDCVALENIKPDILMSEYEQPYPCVVVELPHEYRMYLQKKHNINTIPIFTIINYVKKPYLLYYFYTSLTKYYVNALPKQDCFDKTIHENLVHLEKLVRETKDEQINQALLSIDIVKMCINLMLYSSNFGTSPIGYENIKAQRALERKNPEEAKKTTYYIGLKQSVPIRRETYQKSEPGDGSRKSPQPHWRKGYWRNQPYGPENALRKRKFIPCVFVCGHDYKGNMTDTSVVLE